MECVLSSGPVSHRRPKDPKKTPRNPESGISESHYTAGGTREQICDLELGIPSAVRPFPSSSLAAQCWTRFRPSGRRSTRSATPMMPHASWRPQHVPRPPHRDVPSASSNSWPPHYRWSRRRRARSCSSSQRCTVMDSSTLWCRASQIVMARSLLPTARVSSAVKRSRRQ